MRAAELDLRELLHFDPAGGVMRLAGERTLLLDAVALGLLRRELIRTLGEHAARGVLTRFGYAHGHRTAESLRTALPWDDEREWRIAGGRLHALQGLVTFEPVRRSPDAAARPDEPLAEAIWRDSYEAEQHLLHLGQAESPVCWTLCGFASGYLSRVHGREVYCLETSCIGRGDACCHMEGRERESWGERARDEIAFYEKTCLDESLAAVRDALRRTERALRARRRQLERIDAGPEGVVARSAAMQRVLELATRVARVDSTVLITGESGTGKERVARHIHARSARAGGPFVAINCAALPEELLDSELFGHARGAFTGAHSDRAGLFEAAQGGTLLLDEIGEMAPSTQAKLLRVLQEREVRRVGENRTRPVDARVLAATHRDLTEQVAAGRFREDLSYRIRVVEVHIPPLRERRDDIPALAVQLLRDAAARLGCPVRGFSSEAMALILAHDWPGNVRQLGNAIEHAVALAEGSRIEAPDLPDLPARPVTPSAPPEPGQGAAGTLAAVERAHVLAVLRETGGNRAEAARRLDIGIATLYRKLKQYRAGDSD